MDRDAARIKAIEQYCSNAVFFKETDLGVFSYSLVRDLAQIFDNIKLNNFKNFLDLGSGDGRVVMVASAYTNSTGIECDKALFEKSLDIAKKLGISCTFLNEDYFTHDFSQYDVIFIYPDKPFGILNRKLDKEFKGTLIVYSSIFLPDRKHNKVIELDGMVANVYEYI